MLRYNIKNMKLRIFKRDRIDAISTVISAILAITIFVGAAISTIFLGIPYINDLQSQESLENIEMQFNLIVDNIKDIVTGEADGKNVLTLAIEEGLLSHNKKDFDRTILMYSYGDLNFSISELDNIDPKFKINIISTKNISNVDVFKIKDNGDLSKKLLSTYSYPNITLDPPNDFEDKMVIFLNNSDEILGKIWFFDSESLVFNTQSNTGSHKLILEKGGIIYTNNKNSQVKKLFNIYLKHNSFGLHVLQTNISKPFTLSGEGGFNIRFSIESGGSSLQELNDAYNLRLQLYGENAQTWLSYISNKYVDKFAISDEDNNGLDDTLYLSESHNGIDLIFLNSIVNLNKV
jgi:hypothetical protein